MTAARPWWASAAMRFGWLTFWLLPQELIRYPIEIYGFRRTLCWLAALAVLAVASTALERRAAVTARLAALGRRRVVRVAARVATTLAVIALLVPGVFYWVWLVAYSRLGTIVTALGAGAAVAAARRRGRRWHPASAVMAFTWVAWATVLLVRVPPRPGACPPAAAGVAVLVDRATLDADPRTAGANPFDVALDPRTGAVLVSHQSGLWRGDGAGAVSRIDRPARATPRVRTISLADRPCTRYPDQLAVDAESGRLYVLSSGLGRYCASLLDVRGDRLELVATVPLAGEAKWPVVHDGRLIVLFWPATAAELHHDVLAEVRDGAKLALERTLRAPTEEDAEARLGEPWLEPSGRIAAPSVRGGWFRLDPGSGALEHEELDAALPFSATGDGGAAYLASPVTWRITRIDPATGTVRARRRVPGAPWSVALDAARARVHVATLMGGEVVSLAASDLAPVRRTRVGRLARSLAIDPRDGTVVVASGCGVYALAPPPEPRPAGGAPAPGV